MYHIQRINLARGPYGENIAQTVRVQKPNKDDISRYDTKLVRVKASVHLNAVSPPLNLG